MKPEAETEAYSQRVTPCLAEVYFPGTGRSYSYLNLDFSLREGSWVFVEGAMEGIPGRVRKLSYSFKVRPSDYRKILSAADTDIHGTFYQAGNYLLTFRPEELSGETVSGWYFPPREEEFLQGDDGSSFSMDDRKSWPFSEAVAERAEDYRTQERLAWLSLEGEKGCAIVEGSSPYLVEFTWKAGRVSGLTCTCPCSSCCKHQLTALLMLQDFLEQIEKKYPEQYRLSGAFSAIRQSALYVYVLMGREKGTITI